MKLRAAKYRRVSSDSQDVELSLAGQDRYVEAYAEKEDYSVVADYVDEVESGRTADRPSLLSKPNC